MKSRARRIPHIALAILLLAHQNLQAVPLPTQTIGSPNDTAFSVTVPLLLPILLSGDGFIAVSKEAAIINNGIQPISVTDISFTELGKWKIIDYDSNFSALKINSKVIALELNRDRINLSTKHLDLTPVNWPAISPSDKLPIFYKAKGVIQGYEFIENIAIMTIIIETLPVNTFPLEKPVGDVGATAGDIGDAGDIGEPIKPDPSNSVPPQSDNPEPSPAPEIPIKIPNQSLSQPKSPTSTKTPTEP